MNEQTEGRKRVGRASRLLTAICLLAVLDVAGIGAAMAAGPFTGFSGSWSGSGDVTFKNGSSERIKCRSQYVTSRGNNALQQTLRCASASYQFQLESDVVHSNGTISGSWSEKTNDVSGHVTGEASAGRIRAVVNASKFSASIAVAVSADAQSVIIRPRDEKVAEVSIELRRT